jgi:hypothetical protein
VKTFKTWYTKDGFVQFLLGNQIGRQGWRSVGVVPQMVFAWIGVLMFLVCVIPCMMAHANPFAEMDRAKAKADCLSSLRATYPTQYSTVNRFLKMNMKRFDKLYSLPAGEPYDAILNRLNGTYYPSFSAIHRLYAKELEAMIELEDENAK